jgi:hypothetical protein
MGEDLCPELGPFETCIVLEQYVNGTFERQFHMHVPSRRLSTDSKSALLRSLVMRFYGREGMGAEHIVHLHLNKRGKNPPQSSLPFNHTHPEPGVLRIYCGADTVAWADEVVLPSKFRTAGRGKAT